ncbi:hypothetical protein THASP1DRAFT_28975 [Thamnocephalis sphaerospora]|uniref:Secreted protein n=1 Tax=Thamnocephalis sphaerospora TaxID=78915 RepID=A0A4P9XSX1_9FUNG|nr:hypothetical protein THASP1DRAFT_28975 [Thamnocephalis sphaerospora]|eukprot:RKP09244.1 hypothetical protein THASP1DRAFT_28975 [Thamnocephalis sphaerospora]
MRILNITLILCTLAAAGQAVIPPAAHVWTQNVQVHQTPAQRLQQQPGEVKVRYDNDKPASTNAAKANAPKMTGIPAPASDPRVVAMRQQLEEIARNHRLAKDPQAMARHLHLRKDARPMFAMLLPRVAKGMDGILDSLVYQLPNWLQNVLPETVPLDSGDIQLAEFIARIEDARLRKKAALRAARASAARSATRQKIVPLPKPMHTVMPLAPGSRLGALHVASHGASATKQLLSLTADKPDSAPKESATDAESVQVEESPATSAELEEHERNKETLLRSMDKSFLGDIARKTFGDAGPIFTAAAVMVAADLAQVFSHIVSARRRNLPFSLLLSEVVDMSKADVKYNFAVLAKVVIDMLIERINGFATSAIYTLDGIGGTALRATIGNTLGERARSLATTSVQKIAGSLSNILTTVQEWVTPQRAPVVRP